MRRIAIDYTPAYEQGGGIGRYVRELVTALAQIDQSTDYRLFVSGASLKTLLQPLNANFTWKPTSVTPLWLARIWHRAHVPIPVEIFTGKVDLYHATDFVLPPTLSTTKTILTVHDLSFLRVPETTSPSLKAYLDKVVPRSVNRALHVLADSQATKDDLMALYGTAKDKITVLLSAVDSHFHRVNDEIHLNAVREKYSLQGKDYILSVGTVQPRKNYSRVIRVLAQLRSMGHDIHYVIAGGKGWLEDEMYRTIAEAGLENFVHILGFVDDADLPALYSMAHCTIMVSLYEGFGLPILESMACGTPVITSNVSSLPEVAGDASMLINPKSVNEIYQTIDKMLKDHSYTQELIIKGYEQVKHFTWEKSARHLLEIYESVLNT